MEILSRVVDRVFPRACSREWTIVREQYDADAMGNALVTIEVGRVRAELVRDRGQMFAHLTARIHGNRWTLPIDAKSVAERLGLALELELDTPEQNFVEAIAKLLSDERVDAATRRS